MSLKPPTDIQEYMKSCSEEISLETIQESFSAVQAQATGYVLWLTAITDKPEEMEADDMFDNTPISKLKVVDILKAQQEYTTIKRVLQLRKTNQKLIVRDQRRESSQVRKYLKRLNNLHVEKKWTFVP